MNKFRVLKISVENINFFENDRFEIDFTNKMQVTNHNENHPFYNVSSTIYLPKYIVFNGVNASGKTTIMEIISSFYNFYLFKKSLNENVLDKLYNDKPIISTFIYEFENVIYKVKTKIKNTFDSIYIIKDEHLFNFSSKYIVDEEIIFKKQITTSITKKSLFEEGFIEIVKRSDLDVKEKIFLKDDYSMIEVLNQKSTQRVISRIEKNITPYSRKINVLSREFTENDLAIIKYLDPSIKTLVTTEDDNINFNQGRESTYIIEFETRKPIEVSAIKLFNMLSAGTSKGLSIFVDIKNILKTGGYYIIDDIEVHLNRTIILDIIKLFENSDTNPFNAHYYFQHITLKF